MTLRLPLKVIPGASREAVLWFGEGLKVKVTTAPEKGQANRAVEALLAARLQLPADAINIVSGHTSQLKQVEIDGLSRDAIQQILKQP